MREKLFCESRQYKPVYQCLSCMVYTEGLPNRQALSGTVLVHHQVVCHQQMTANLQSFACLTGVVYC